MGRIADGRKSIAGVSAARWVPSTALLIACHYRAVESAPSFESIKSFNEYSHLFDEKGSPRDANYGVELIAE